MWQFLTFKHEIAIFTEHKSSFKVVVNKAESIIYNSSVAQKYKHIAIVHKLFVVGIQMQEKCFIETQHLLNSGDAIPHI